MIPLVTDRPPSRLGFATPVLAWLVAAAACPSSSPAAILTAGRSVRILNAAGREPLVTVRIGRDPALRRLADPTCPAPSSVTFAFARESLAVDDRGAKRLPCAGWRRTGDGYHYSDPTAVPGGVQDVVYTHRGVVIRGGAGTAPIPGPLTYAETFLEIASRSYLIRAYDFVRNDPSRIASRAPSRVAAAGEAAFWDALAGEADQEVRALALLRRAVAQNPRDGRSWFYLGNMHVYRAGGLPHDAASASRDTYFKTSAGPAQEAFDRAVKLLPNDSLPAGFRAITTYYHGLAEDDPGRQAAGVAQITEASGRNTFFNKAIGLFFLPRYFPRTSEYFENVLLPQVDQVRAVASVCPRTYPDVCRSRLVKWGLEGAGILLGDVAAKGGSLSDATWWYTIADGVGRGAGYPFQAIAEERVAHAAERVALYQDADPRNDPPFLGEEASVCTYCHFGADVSARR
jgi:hypothetical protein